MTDRLYLIELDNKSYVRDVARLCASVEARETTPVIATGAARQLALFNRNQTTVSTQRVGGCVCLCLGGGGGAFNTGAKAVAV